MPQLPHPSKWLLPAVVALPLLVACSSSNNKNNNANTNATTNNAAAVRTVPATTPPSVLASTPSLPPVRLSPTPSARVVSPTPARSQATASAGSPAAGASSSASDPALQAALQKAVLQGSDLPSGFMQQTTDSTVDSSIGEVANYGVVYTNTGQGSSGSLNIQAVVADLAGFKDQATATSNLKQLQQQITSIPGSNFTVTPVQNPPSVGSETQAFKVNGTDSGITLGGYAIVWRHGRLGALIIQVGAPALSSIDALTPIAQAQDAKLNSVQ